ncbi:hypothetical protein ACFX2I_012544 [Malus domestica]
MSPPSSSLATKRHFTNSSYDQRHRANSFFNDRRHHTFFDSLYKASTKVVDILTTMAIPIKLTDRDSFVKSAST